ncbi:MAG: ATP-binding protein [Saprospiraceae bacterium]|nr:ATP-binding protein [Saprospiraceae bacterium]
MHLRYGVLLFALIIGSGAWTSVRAQDVEVIPLDDKLIRISYWKESSGLPNWDITDMIQDQRGLVWMGTELGLVSLDGKNFKIHPLQGVPSVVQNIRRILLDEQQYLWLFCATPTSDITILIYDPYQEKTISFEAYTGASVKFSNSVVSTIHTADSLLWVLDAHKGIGGYFGPDHHWHEVLHTAPREDTKRFFLPTSKHQFWHLNVPDNSVDLIGPEGGILAHYTLPGAFRYLELRMGTDGSLYLLGTENGQKEKHPRLFRCDASRGIVSVSALEMYTLTWRNVGNNGYKLPPVWANNAKGINLIREASGVLGVFDQNRPLYRGLESHFSKNGIKACGSRIFVFRDGSFWMVGIGVLIRIEVSENDFTTYFKDLATPPSTRAMVTYGNSLYVNSYAGLYEINLQSKKSRLFHDHFGRGIGVQGSSLWSSQHHESVFSWVLPHKKHQAYIIDPSDSFGEFEEVHHTVAGGVYVGSLKAVFYKAPNDTAFMRLPNVTGSTFYQNRAGLWIGGGNGIWLLNNLNQPIKHFTKEIVWKGQLPSDITDLHEDASGIFWMATKEGLWRWNPGNGEVQTYTRESHDLPTNVIHAVYEDRHERLWMPSQNGLLCFDKKKDKFRTFTSLDGLPGNEFNRLSHYQDPSGRLYFGGVYGIVSFHPDSLTEKPPSQELNIQLLGLYLKQNHSSDAPFNLTHAALFGNKTLLIPHGADELEINFCVPAFLREHIQYRWRIPEIDSGWHKLSEPRFSVYRLPFGHYTLELGATFSENSLLQAASLKLPIRVDRPYYIKAWFLFLAAILIVGLTIFLTRWRQQQLRQLSRRLAAEVAEKTVELQQERDVIAKQAESLHKLDEEKNRFFQDVSHEIRNPLTLIIGPVNDFLKREDLPVHYRDRLERVHRNAKKILHLVDEVLEISKLEAGMVPIENGIAPLANFITRICQDFEGVAMQKNVSFQLSHTLSPGLNVQIDVRKLEKILINLVQNAFKFTPAGGSVQVNAHWTPDGLLQVLVQDTGIGIAVEHMPRIFERYYQISTGSDHAGKRGFGIGLAMCRHYTNLLGGKIEAQSSPGKGTTILLSIPCNVVNPAAAPAKHEDSDVF